MDRISRHKNILIYGCGGGYDVYGCLPLYEELIADGKSVIFGTVREYRSNGA